MHLYNVHYNLE